MPAYQSDYIGFYESVMKEVDEMTRIKVHERVNKYLQSKWFSFKLFVKYKVIGRIKGYYSKMKSIWESKGGKTVYGTHTASFCGVGRQGVVRACREAPRNFHSLYEPMDEQISLSQFAYGKMIDQKFKRRFIDSENHRSNESIYSLKQEAVKYVYKQKLDASVLLRIAVFLHFT